MTRPTGAQLAPRTSEDASSCTKHIHCITNHETRSIQREVHREAIADLDGLAALLARDEFWEGLHHANRLVVQQRVDASKDGDVNPEPSVSMTNSTNTLPAKPFRGLSLIFGFRNHMLGQLLVGAVSASFPVSSLQLPKGDLLHNVVDLGAVRSMESGSASDCPRKKKRQDKRPWSERQCGRRVSCQAWVWRHQSWPGW